MPDGSDEMGLTLVWREGSVIRQLGVPTGTPIEVAVSTANSLREVPPEEWLTWILPTEPDYRL